MLISFGSSVKSNNVTTTDSVWTEFLTTHKRLKITAAEYKSLDENGKAAIKETLPYFVGCGFTGGKRKGLEAQRRQLLTLDADFGRPIRENILYDHILYSTLSHTEEKPRFRIVLPLSREVNRREYQIVARYVMKEIGQHLFDQSTSVDYARAMFLPVCTADAEPVFIIEDGFMGEVDVDQIMKDVPETDYVPHTGRKDPRTAPGIIGEFCTVWSITEAIRLFLPQVYRKDGERYTFNGASTVRGGMVFDKNTYFYSKHDSDPACDGHCQNAFDLVRIHKFGGDQAKTEAWADTLDGIRIHRQRVFEKALETAEQIKDTSRRMKNCSKFLLEAPGLLGEMVRDILPNMDRIVPEYAVAGALHSMSLGASESYRNYSRASKLNLMTIIIGPSASGKDVPQRYVNTTAKKIVGVPAWPGFTSYQEITKNLFRGDGTAIYAVDECQKMFRAGKSQESYLSGLGDEIMSIYTEERFLGFRGNDREALQEEWEKKKRGYESQLTKDGNLSPEDEERIREKIEDCDKKLDMIKNGIEKPNLSVYGSTTPASFEQFINEESLNNGNFGRFVWVVPDMLDNDEGIPPLNDNDDMVCTGEFSPHIEQKLIDLVRLGREKGMQVVSLNPEAKIRTFEIKKELDSVEKRNHKYGALYRRAYHKVTKIASIMGAADGGMVTPAHLDWAYQYVNLDLKAVTRQQMESQIPEDEKRSTDAIVTEAYRERLFDILDKNPEGLKQGRLIQLITRKKKYGNKEFAEKIIEHYLTAGKLTRDPANTLFIASK